MNENNKLYKLIHELLIETIGANDISIKQEHDVSGYESICLKLHISKMKKLANDIEVEYIKEKDDEKQKREDESMVNGINNTINCIKQNNKEYTKVENSSEHDTFIYKAIMSEPIYKLIKEETNRLQIECLANYYRERKNK